MSVDDTTGFKRITATIQTTDATVTTCGSYTLPDECAAFVSAKVLGVQSGSANTGGFLLNAVVEAQSGTRALVSTADQTIIKRDVGTWDAVIDVSGNDVRVRVTGVAATTIDWQTTLEITLFKP